MFYFKQTRLEDGRFTFTRALQSLDKRDVAETAVKFAQIEFKYGDAERGEKLTLFIYTILASFFGSFLGLSSIAYSMTADGYKNREQR
jgi:hypothetical protein